MVNRLFAPIASIAFIAVIAACGPSPRPVPPSLHNPWPTVLGSARRAAFENERVPESLTVAWDIDAGTGLRASVLVTDSAVFAATTNRQLLAFGTRTGRRFWDQRMEGEIASDLVRSGRTLFFTTAEWSGRIHARDMERGRKVWRVESGPVRFSPLLDGGIAYVGSDRGIVHALRTEDGTQLWRRALPGAIAATLLSHGDALLAVTSLDTIYRLSRRDGAIVARAPIASSITAAPALAGDTVVIVTQAGAVFALDATTLAQHWRVDTGAPILAAPIVARDGAVHVANRDATIWRITQGSGTIVAALGGTVAGSFTLARDRYVLGKFDGTLVVTDLDGRVVAEHRFNDSIIGPVAVHDGALYVPLLHGRIVKLQ